MTQITVHPLVEGLDGHTGWVDVETEGGPTHRFAVYQMADERRVSCGPVHYQCAAGRRPGCFCHGEPEPPAWCTLANELCAFKDSDFDWTRVLVPDNAPDRVYDSPEAWQEWRATWA